MKKIRQNFKDMKKEFLSGSYEGKARALWYVNIIVGSLFYLFLVYTSIGIYWVYGITWIGIVLFAISFAMWFISLFSSIFYLISYRVLFWIFGRYGNVVTRADWKRIKKLCPKGYKLIWSKKAIGKCYDISWYTALYIKDAKLMYCSIKLKDGGATAHSVIVKGNCVYDTNERQHFDYSEYLKNRVVEVYRIFDGDIFRKKGFFDNIRDDFVKWCSERNVICYF